MANEQDTHPADLFAGDPDAPSDVGDTTPTNLDIHPADLFADPDFAAHGPQMYRFHGPNGSEINSRTLPSGADQNFNYTPDPSVMAGAGAQFYNWGQGIAQITGNTAPGQFGSPEAIAEQRQIQAPLMNSWQGKVGAILPNVAVSAFAPGAGAAGFAANTGIQAGLGALTPTEEGESRLSNAGWGGLGGAVGYGAGRLLGSFGQPFVSKLSGSDSDAVSLLTEHGVPLDAAQSTGSGYASWLKGLASNSPFGLGQFPATQQHAFTKAVSTLLGGDADGAASDSLTSSFMSGARKRITDTRTSIMNDNPVSLFGSAAKGQSVPQSFDSALNDVLQKVNAPGELEEADKNTITNQIQRLRASAQANDGTVTPSVFKNVRSTIQDWSATNNGTLKEYGGKLQGMLDNAQEAQIANPADYDILHTANNQYRNLQFVDDAIKDNEGQVPPKALVSQIDRKRNIGLTAYGNGEQSLWNLADAGKRILPDTGTSSTTKAMIGQGIGYGTLGGLVGYAQGERGWPLAATVGGAALVPGVGRLLTQPATSTVGKLTTGLPVRYSQWAANNPALNNVIRPGLAMAGASLGANATIPGANSYQQGHVQTPVSQLEQKAKIPVGWPYNQ